MSHTSVVVRWTGVVGINCVVETDGEIKVARCIASCCDEYVPSFTWLKSESHKRRKVAFVVALNET